MRNLTKDALGMRHVTLAEPVDFLKLLFRGAHSRQFHAGHREIIPAVHIANGQQFRHFEAVERKHFLPNQRPGVFVEVEQPLSPNRQHDAFLPHSYFLLVSRQNIASLLWQLLQRVVRNFRRPSLSRRQPFQHLAVLGIVGKFAQDRLYPVSPLCRSRELFKRCRVSSVRPGNQRLHALSIILALVEPNETGNAAHPLLKDAQQSFNRFGPWRCGVTH